MINVFFIGFLILLCIIYCFALYLLYKFIKKKNRTIAIITLLILPPLTITAIYNNWHSGTPYGDREYDESGQYYFQRYSTLGPSAFEMSMPGNGSDSIDGFIRLYDSNGNLLNEHFTKYLLGIQPTWLDDSLWLMGTPGEVSFPLKMQPKRQANKSTAKPKVMQPTRVVPN